LDKTVLWKTTSHEHDSDQDKTLDDTQKTENTQSQHGAPVIHRFTGGPSGIHHNEAPTINKDSTPMAVETNRYYHQYLDSMDDRQPPLSDMTLKEIYSFFALTL
jgi:hypothetical protein